MLSDAGEVISLALGVVYVVAWSISFYPQAILNWRRQSVQGLSVDFLTLNPFGFACYSVANVLLYSSRTVRKHYKLHNGGHLPSVRINDILFAVHAFTISSFTLFQSYLYRGPVSQRQRMSTYNASFLVLATLAIVFAILIAGTGKRAPIEWLDVVYLLSWTKLYISFAKYVPQAYLNYHRQSTSGWSIVNILLDLTGGVLSLAQLILDCARSGDWRAITGNPGKLGLGLLSIAFDGVFILQHYVLYRGNPEPEQVAPGQVVVVPQGQEGEREPLLGQRASS